MTLAEYFGPEGDVPDEEIWADLCAEAQVAAQDDPRLAHAMALNILGRPGFAHGLTHRFSQTLVNNDVGADVLTDLDLEVIEAAPPEIIESAILDIQAVSNRAGVPVRPVGRPKSALPGVTMEQTTIETDYVI